MSRVTQNNEFNRRAVEEVQASYSKIADACYSIDNKKYHRILTKLRVRIHKILSQMKNDKLGYQ